VRPARAWLSRTALSIAGSRIDRKIYKFWLVVATPEIAVDDLFWDGNSRYVQLAIMRHVPAPEYPVVNLA
jgi:hypothetical protein